MNLAAMPLPPEGTPVEIVLDRVKELAVLPQVIHKIVDLTGSESSSATTMESAIVVDPGFSAKLLTCANSAFYGLPRKVTSIREAVMFLGFKAVRQLAMTVGVFDLFVGKNDAESLRRRSWWRTSLDAAVCARWISETTRSCRPEEAYTCGLLHYIGKTLLDRFDSSLYATVVEAVESGLDDLNAETAVYGCNHVEVAMAAARGWGFPDTLVEGLAYCDSSPSPAAGLRCSVAIGHGLSLIAQGQSERALPEWALGGVQIAPDREQEIIVEGLDAIAKAATLRI